MDNAIHKTRSAPHQQLMDKGKEMASLPKEQRAHPWERPRPLAGGEGRRLWAKYEILQGGPTESRVGGRSPRWGCMCRQMSVSQACCNKLPQTGRLIKPQMYHLTALEARVRDQGVSQAPLPTETAGENLFLPLPASGGTKLC